MNKPIIISEKFLVALREEIQTQYDILENYDPRENIFDKDDHIRYRDELIKILDWTITE